MAMIHPQVMTIQPAVVTTGMTTTAYGPGMEMWSSGLFSCFDDMESCGYQFLLLLTDR